LAHAISSTRPTALSRISSGRRTSPIATSRSRVTSKPVSRIDRPPAEGAPPPGLAWPVTLNCRPPPLLPESLALRRAASSLTSPTTRSMETPGARRATALRKCTPRSVSTCGFCDRNSPIGVHTCTSSLGNWNPAGITPTTVKLRPSSEIDRPRMPGSRPKLVTQSPWLRRASGVRSSAGAKLCPISGRNGSTSNRLAVTAAAWTSRGSPAPVKLWRCVLTAATPVKSCDSARKSWRSGNDTPNRTPRKPVDIRMVIAHPNASPIRRYQDLRVWQASMELVVEIYRASESFPKRETYGLTAQCRRAAVSLPSNIAEGHGRKHLGDYLHQLS